MPSPPKTDSGKSDRKGLPLPGSHFHETLTTNCKGAHDLLEMGLEAGFATRGLDCKRESLCLIGLRSRPSPSEGFAKELHPLSQLTISEVLKLLSLRLDPHSLVP
jgi:hypothetical protein